MDIKERFYANLDLIREEEEQLDEKAKWRKTKVAKKVTDPEGYDSVSYDYHSDNPRSTGMMKATSDKPYSYGSLMTRGKAKITSKGKVTKSSADKLKDKIKANLKMYNKLEEEQLDEKAKWRKTKVATKVTDPEGYDSASYDYHKSNPRSTGMMKATSDMPYKSGSLMTRRKPKIKKGKITKGSAEKLKDRIKANLKK